MTFAWSDSFASLKKTTSASALLEMYSSLYNYGVACSRVGILMNLEGDGIKIASKNLCQAAAIFDNLKTQVN